MSFNSEMVRVPAGTLYFGPKARQVEMESFQIMKFPVTCAQWVQVARNLPKINLDLDLNPGEVENVQVSKLPVTKMLWADVQEFIARVSLLDEVDYYLPTEAQWEYSLKGSLLEYPSLEGNTIDANNWKLTPVDKYHPNHFGIADMVGNAWELTAMVNQGIYTQTLYEGEGEVLIRGGSYGQKNFNCETIRSSVNPSRYLDGVGFRLVVND